jgi:hypothetical protein
LAAISSCCFALCVIAQPHAGPISVDEVNAGRERDRQAGGEHYFSSPMETAIDSMRLELDWVVKSA